MEFRGYGPGYCISCGLLGKRDSQSTVSLCYEATAVDRISGTLTEFRGQPTGSAGLGKRPLIHTHPWCFLGKADFLTELIAMGAEEHQADKMQELLRKDRACPAWYPWREFLSPKEHWEEQMTLAMTKQREDFELRMEGERREFELRSENDNRRERKRTNRIMVWLAVAAIIFAAAEVYAALSAINPNHWLFDWLR